jgi:taurine dioxygenase
MRKLLMDGWVAEYDVKLKDLPADELRDVLKDIFQYQVLVFHDQDLDVSSFLRIAENIGTVHKSDGDRASVWAGEGVIRVTGDQKEPGLFGHKEALDWHANQPSNANRKKLIWLYAVKGAEDSRTSWLNNALAYDDLPSNIKQKIEHLHVYCGYKRGRYSDSPFFKEHVDRNNPMPLVQKFGPRKGLFFPFLQVFEIAEMPGKESDDLLEYLQAHVVQDKYIWHHDWKQQDLNISEQILTIHKRWPFENMEERLLWRLASGHEQIF